MQSKRGVRTAARREWLNKIVADADTCRLVRRTLKSGGITASQLASALKSRGLGMTTVGKVCYIAKM